MIKANRYPEKLKILIVISIFMLVACGIKGPPLPPIEEETIQSQKAGGATAEIISGDATKARPSSEKVKK